MNGLSSNTAAASSEATQRQVRLQLSTRDPDIALPENTGPILVPTGNCSSFSYSPREYADVSVV